MRVGLFLLIYVVVGLLVAGGIIGDEDKLLLGLDNLEETIDMVLAVLLRSLVLPGVDINLGGMTAPAEEARRLRRKAAPAQKARAPVEAAASSARLGSPARPRDRRIREHPPATSRAA